MSQHEIDSRLTEVLTRLERRYQQREQALDAYIAELEDRLAEALGTLSERVERLAALLGQLSEQHQELHRQLSKSRSR